MSAATPARRNRIHPLRDGLVAGVITFVTSAVGLSFIYVKARDAQLDAVRGELLQLARTTAAQVDGDLHSTITRPGQELTPEYREAMAPLVRMHRAAKDVFDVYTGVLRNEKVYWILDTSWEYPAPGDDEPPEAVMTPYENHDPELMRAFHEKIAIANVRPVRDPDHTYLSAFAPIYNSRHEMVAVLGVDMVLDALEARMATVRNALIEALLLVLVLSIGAGAVAMRFRKFAATIVHRLREARAQADVSAAEAQAASRAKGSFLAMMSHEIRTPMNGMLGVAELLRTMSPNAEQKRLLDILASSGASLVHIINDILDFSKMEVERLELRPQAFDLRAMIDELQHLLGAPAQTKGVAFIVEADEDLPSAVVGDRQRLTQVLLNLGTNAVKFTDHGEVRLLIRAQNADPTRARLSFAVTDTGIGMSEDALAKLFTPFTQVAESRRHRGGGTGLGLVIAQKLVALMGGAIQVRSAPNQGSTFSFDLELPAASSASDSLSVPILRLDSLAVLVAEDNAVNQTIIGAMLRQLGHRATIVENGCDALAALDDGDYDLVLMDCNMPLLDGLEATRQLRAGKSASNDSRVPVIALTANAMDHDREACFAAGMNGFLAKPLTIAALRTAIDAARAPRKAAVEQDSRRRA
jgi:signal transduction histidine kinase/ActR/RegA family two-component response regulator